MKLLAITVERSILLMYDITIDLLYSITFEEIALVWNKKWLLNFYSVIKKKKTIQWGKIVVYRIDVIRM